MPWSDVDIKTPSFDKSFYIYIWARDFAKSNKTFEISHSHIYFSSKNVSRERSQQVRWYPNHVISERMVGFRVAGIQTFSGKSSLVRLNYVSRYT
jgi:hypothetical protein